MTCFRDFTAPDWEVFGGNALMLVTCAFYLAWWALAFWPKGIGYNSLTAILITVALLAGIASIAVLSLGVAALPRIEKGLPVSFVLLGAAVLFVFFLAVTKNAFHRPVTSELLVMFIWAAVEFSAILALSRSGRFADGQIALLSTLVTIAMLVGLACYVLYYRLEGLPGFWDGLIPLATDAAVVAVFLSVQATS